MKTIQLSRGKQAIVDDEDYERINRHKWFVQEQENGDFYAVRKTSHNYKVTKIYMHREVLGAIPGQFVDHRNFNTLDNRKTEIRLCSSSQNAQHARLAVNNTSGYKGVTLFKDKFDACIRQNGKTRNLGRFRTIIEAAQAYDKAALRLFGQFACTNAMLGRYSR